MTTLFKSIQKPIEDLEDELASLQFDIDHKQLSGMELMAVMGYMNKLKCERARIARILNYNKSCM